MTNEVYDKDEIQEHTIEQNTFRSGQFMNSRYHRNSDLTKNSVRGVHGNLVLSGITNETLGISESNIGRCGSVTLIICDYLHAIMLPNSDTRICSAEINTDGWSLSLTGHSFFNQRRQVSKANSFLVARV